jgi:hypothetical protein
MKKHSKRKFVGNFKVDFNFDEVHGYYENAKTHDQIDIDEYPKVLMQMQDKTVIQGFMHIVSGKPLIIPEPEPSILYFTNAENKLTEILELQSKIIRSRSYKDFNEISHTFFSFFQLSSDFIINLYTSIEAYNNSIIISSDFSIKIKKRNYNRNEALRELDFLTKVKRIPPHIKNISFVKTHPIKYEHFLKIKNLRDNVIHTKNMQDGFPASYRELYKSYLEFDFKKSYDYVKDYFNFYEKDWIEDCNCNL